MKIISFKPGVMYRPAECSILPVLFLCLFSFSLPAQVIERSLSANHWQFKKTGETKWLDAKVPGTVHTDLLDNGLIPDPFYGTNEQKLQWIENEDWEYRTAFILSLQDLLSPHILLEFDGLDTYARVYVNDSLVLSADNMFRKWNVEVKKYVRAGKNSLNIVFESAIKRGEGEASKLPYVLPGEEKVFSRKAQYQYGWDWGPRFVTCGIWKEARLLFWKQARILNVHAVQHFLSDSLAELEFICQIESDGDGEHNFQISRGLAGDTSGQRPHKVNLKKGINRYSFRYALQQPRRWWCRGLGEAFQYDFTFRLSAEPGLLDTKHIKTGLRTIELVQEKDKHGVSFLFKLNGIPVFIKGANYIPQDNFLPRVKAEDYQRIVKEAADAHINMLRVWGGGVYADDLFYAACNEQGILVWQDFMFACAMYPGDAYFVENVKQEVIGQVERLRNHPSLALWCGNNEVDEGWKNWGWQKQYRYTEKDSAKIATDNALLFTELIKGIVTQYDPSRDYWPSSPQIGWGHKESLQQGDAHYWGVWWGMEPFENYTKKVGRFMSEYGFQGMPDRYTLYDMGAYKNQAKKSLRKVHLLEPDSAVIRAHQKHPRGYQTIGTYMERDYVIPSVFGDYAYVSQLLQAKGIKTAIEAHRRAKPYCMGTLFWQLNDCWPVTSWSTMDHRKYYKAAHYQIKRSYKEVILSVEEKNDSCNIYIVSDLPYNITSTLLVELFDLEGKKLWSHAKAVSIGAMSSGIYYCLPKNVPTGYDKKKIVLRSTLLGDHSCEDFHFFTQPKHLELKTPKYKLSVGNCKGVQCISISAAVLLKDVYIVVQEPNLNLSDNYFDLLPGSEKVILLPANKRVKHLKKKIIVKSLRDTYPRR